MEKVHRHIGEVVEVSDNKYTIKVCSLAACASCHLTDQCPSSDKKEKFIDIDSSNSRKLSLGEEVIVLISHKNGIFAYSVAYVAPIVLVIVAMIILYVISAPELVAALTILLIITIYYIGLYLLRDKISKKIEIKIE